MYGLQYSNTLLKTQITLTVQWMLYEANLGSKPNNDIIQAT